MISINCTCVEYEGKKERVYSFVKDKGANDQLPPVEVRLQIVPVLNINTPQLSYSQAYYSQFVWPAAVVLSGFITYLPGLFVNKCILELGAGKALCSMTAKAVGARTVVATDFNSNDGVGNGAAVTKLRWGEFNKASINHLCSNGSNRLDIIIGSDLFYEESQESDAAAEEKVDSVLSMIVLAKKYNPDLIFICSAVIRTFEQYQMLLQSLCNWKLETIRKYTPKEFIKNCSPDHCNIEILMIR